MDLLKRKYCGSTLIEAIVSMLIISVTFLLAFSVITSIGKRSSSSKYKAYILVHKELSEIKLSNSVSDTAFKIGNIEIQRTVKVYNNIPNLYDLEIKAYDNKKYLLYDYRELIDFKNSVVL